MRQDVIAKLNALNRTFYDTFAEAFTRSRGSTEPGLSQILKQVNRGERFLDLGCGQGRVALLLPEGCTYIGLDFSQKMLRIAQDRAKANHRQAKFIKGDLLHPYWPSEVLEKSYDWILLRAVLHHIPAIANRQQILSRAASCLHPDGKIILANWQFLEIPRLRRRILPWETIKLVSTDTESGDYLLDWQREGYGLRYVHLVDEAETQTLAKRAGLEIIDLFRADGHNNKLTLYAILKKPSL